MFPTLPRRPRGLHLAHHLGVPPLAHVGVSLDHLGRTQLPAFWTMSGSPDVSMNLDTQVWRKQWGVTARSSPAARTA